MEQSTNRLESDSLKHKTAIHTAGGIPRLSSKPTLPHERKASDTGHQCTCSMITLTMEESITRSHTSHCDKHRATVFLDRICSLFFVPIVFSYILPRPTSLIQKFRSQLTIPIPTPMHAFNGEKKRKLQNAQQTSFCPAAVWSAGQPAGNCKKKNKKACVCTSCVWKCTQSMYKKRISLLSSSASFFSQETPKTSRSFLLPSFSSSSTALLMIAH